MNMPEKPDSVSVSLTDYLRAGLAGAVVAATGAFVWVKLTAATEKSYGAVAVLIGLLTGPAVRWGIKRGGIVAGSLAGLFTLSALLAARYFILFDYLLKQARSQGYTGVEGLSFAVSLRFINGWDWLFVAMGVYLAFRTAFSSAPLLQFSSKAV